MLIIHIDKHTYSFEGTSQKLLMSNVTDAFVMQKRSVAFFQCLHRY